MSFSEGLARKHRPRRFSEVGGQVPSVALLYQMCARHAIPEAMVFTGPRGTGKTSSARIVAAAVNCEAPPGPADSWPCLQCPSCKAVWADTHLEYIEVDAASHGGVAEIRKLRDEVAYSGAALHRVVCLDEVHSASRDAFNAMLKILEEPPDGTSFILVTTELDKVPATVLSRCLPFRFPRLSPAVISARLAWICEQEGISPEPGLLDAIASRADGALRDAVMSLDQLHRVGIYDLARYRALAGDDDCAPGLVEAMLDGDNAVLFARLDAVLEQDGDFAAVSRKLVTCLKELLVLCAGGQIAVQGPGLEARRFLAARLDAARVGAAMRVLWDLRTRTARQDLRSNLELACVVVAERLRPQSPPAAGNGNGNGHTPMSLAQLKELTAGG